VKLLGLAWAELAGTGSKQGNFKEAWQLSWQPESSLYLNEMSLWGNSIQLATQSYLEHQIKQCEDVAQIAQLIESILLSGLDQSLNLALDKQYYFGNFKATDYGDSLWQCAPIFNAAFTSSSGASCDPLDVEFAKLLCTTEC